MNFEDQLKAMILNDQAPEILGMMARFCEQQSTKIYGDVESSSQGEYIPRRKTIRLAMWWSYQAHALERCESQLKDYLADRDLTDEQRDAQELTRAIGQKEADLERLKARRN